MGAQLLEGKLVAAKIKEQIKIEAEALKQKYGRAPKLVSIQVGENPGAEVYIKSQEKNAKDLGIDFELKKLEEKTTQDELIKIIGKLNNDKTVNGIILQTTRPPSRRWKNGSLDAGGRRLDGDLGETQIGKERNDRNDHDRLPNSKRPNAFANTHVANLFLYRVIPGGLLVHSL